MNFDNTRIFTFFSLIIITPIGCYSKFYKGPAADWVNDSLGGTFYVIFWCLFFFFIFNHTKPWLISTMVLLITCLLEFLQLWHPPFLNMLRNNFIGLTILGHSFNWSDFPYYFLGGVIGRFWLTALTRFTHKRKKL